MGVAALILGIVSTIFGFVPSCGIIAFVPAVVGLILGIIDIVQKSKKNEPRGMAIAGVILTGIAIIVISLWTFIFSAIFIGTADYLDNNQDEISTYFNDEIDTWEDFGHDFLDNYYSNYYEESL